jgi:hypothetical protein
LPLKFERIVSIAAVETCREITPLEVAAERTPFEVEAISAIVAKAPVVIATVVITTIIIEAAVIAVIGEGIAIALPAKLLLPAIAISELAAIVASVELLTAILRGRLLHIRGWRILLATAPELLPAALALAALAAAPVTLTAAIRIGLLHVRHRGSRGSLLGLRVLLASTTALPAPLLLLLLLPLGNDAASVLKSATSDRAPRLVRVLLLLLSRRTNASRRLCGGRK